MGKEKLDRDLLHDYLWENSDHRTGVLKLTQLEIADRLMITNAHLSRIFSDFKRQGRISKKGLSFIVTDPAVWSWQPFKP